MTVTPHPPATAKADRGANGSELEGAARRRRIHLCAFVGETVTMATFFDGGFEIGVSINEMSVANSMKLDL